MAFKLEDAQAMPMLEYRQSEEKRTKYTVTDIGGPSEHERWKAEMALKEEIWKAKKAQRRADVIRGMNDGSLANKVFGVSETTKAYKAYAEDQAEQRRSVSYMAALNDMKNELVLSKSQKKIPMLTRIYNYLFDKFVSIQLP